MEIPIFQKKNSLSQVFACYFSILINKLYKKELPVIPQIESAEPEQLFGENKDFWFFEAFYSTNTGIKGCFFPRENIEKREYEFYQNRFRNAVIILSVILVKPVELVYNTLLKVNANHDSRYLNRKFPSDQYDFYRICLDKTVWMILPVLREYRQLQIIEIKRNLSHTASVIPHLPPGSRLKESLSAFFSLFTEGKEENDLPAGTDSTEQERTQRAKTLQERIDEFDRECQDYFENLTCGQTVIRLFRFEDLFPWVVFAGSDRPDVFKPLFNQPGLCLPESVEVNTIDTLRKKSGRIFCSLKYSGKADLQTHFIFLSEDIRKLEEKSRVKGRTLIDKLLSNWKTAFMKMKIRIPSCTITSYDLWSKSGPEQSFSAPFLLVTYYLKLKRLRPVRFKQIVSVPLIDLMYKHFSDGKGLSRKIKLIDKYLQVNKAVGNLLITQDTWEQFSKKLILFPAVPGGTVQPEVEGDTLLTINFLDLQNLRNIDLRILLQELFTASGIKTVFHAFRNIPPDFFAKILRNLSQNSADDLKELLKYGESSTVEINQARKKVLSFSFGLFRERKIKLTDMLFNEYKRAKKKEEKLANLETELLLQSSEFTQAVAGLDNRQVQSLIRRVQWIDVVYGLFQADTGTVEKFSMNMSKDAKKLLAEDQKHWQNKEKNKNALRPKIACSRRELLEEAYIISENKTGKLLLDYYCHAIIFYSMGEYELAIEQCENAFRIRKETGKQIKSMFDGLVGWIYAVQGIRLDEARKYAEQAELRAESRLEKAFHIDTTGWIYHLKGDNETALQLLLEAKILAPNEQYLIEHIIQVQNSKKPAVP